MNRREEVARRLVIARRDGAKLLQSRSPDAGAQRRNPGNIGINPGFRRASSGLRNLTPDVRDLRQLTSCNETVVQLRRRNPRDDVVVLVASRTTVLATHENNVIRNLVRKSGWAAT